MRVPADHLLANSTHNVRKCERARFGRHLRMKHDLQQQVAKLALERGQVGALDRIRDLVRFLDSVGGNGPKILFQVPRTAAIRVPQPRHDVEQRIDALRLLRSVHGR